MKTLTSACQICRLDLHNIAKVICSEIDIKENEIDEVPTMFGTPYFNRPLVDVYKINVLDVAEAIGIVLVQNLERHATTELSIMRMYFGKQDNVANYVAYRGMQIASELRDEMRGVKYVCVAEGPRLSIEAIGRLPYRGLYHEE